MNLFEDGLKASIFINKHLDKVFTRPGANILTLRNIFIHLVSFSCLAEFAEVQISRFMM